MAASALLEQDDCGPSVTTSGAGKLLLTAQLKVLQVLGVVAAKSEIDKKYAREPVLKKLGSK